MKRIAAAVVLGIAAGFAVFGMVASPAPPTTRR